MSKGARWAEIVIVLIPVSNLKPLDKQVFPPHLPPPLALGVLPGRGKPTYVQPTS
jgi:hypothetical protein